MDTQKWVPFFVEFADKVLEYKNKREELIEIVEDIYSEMGLELPNDKRLTKIEPFFLMLPFNRHCGLNDKRDIYCKLVKDKFNIKADLPQNYHGIPTRGLARSIVPFFNKLYKNNKKDFDGLWDFYEIVIKLADNNDSNLVDKFIEYFDRYFYLPKLTWSLTILLFDIRPFYYVNLDSTNRGLIEKYINENDLYNTIIYSRNHRQSFGKEYLDFSDFMRNYCDKNEYGNLVEFSYSADSDKYEDDIESNEDYEEEYTQYWVYSPGSDAYAWEHFYDKGIMGLGWSELGDLSQYESREDIQNKLNEIHGGSSSTNSSLANWEFCNSIQVGDVVYAKKGKNIILGKGVVTSDYIYEENESEFYSIRKVKWENKGYWECDNLALKTLTEITYNQDLINNIEDIIRKGLQMVVKERNRILYGAPGTGKSYKLKVETKEKFIAKNVERVTFHSDYIYANFVGSYKPKPKTRANGEEYISYEFVAGPFIKILKQALKNKDEEYLLIIEEINRADTASVFGDIFQLLDRDEDGNSEYPITVSEELKAHLEENDISLEDDKLYIPSNMYIWATMNNADQGVFPLDTAFKRRWSFEYLDIDNNESKIADYTINIKDKDYKWNDIRKAINNGLINQNINEDKLLGPYFIKVDRISKDKIIDKDKFNSIFKEKVLMYLFEDAAKHKRNEIFNLKGDSILFSKLCSEFGNDGLDIFVDSIKNEIKPINNEETNNTDEAEQDEE